MLQLNIMEKVLNVFIMGRHGNKLSVENIGHRMFGVLAAIG